MKFFFFILIFLVFVKEIFSQTQEVRGFVFDKTTNLPIQYATIEARKILDSAFVKGIATDSSGYFTLKKLPTTDKLSLKIRFLGYKNKVISLHSTEKIVFLDTVFLEDETNLVNSVVVSAEKKSVQYSLDKKIITPTANSGTITDILKTIPSVSVDGEGNLLLRGSGRITILIDGRPSNLSGVSLLNVLEQIPPDMIENIEVITNPSARYVPDGMGGIINIKMKRNARKGFNAILNLTLGTTTKHNGSVNLSYKNEYFNIFAGYDFRKFYMKTDAFANRTSFVADTTTYMVSNGLRRNNTDTHTFRFGMDFYLPANQTLGFQISYTDNYIYRPYDTESDEYNTHNQVFSHFERYEEDKVPSFQNIFAGNYRKTFSQKNREIMVDFNFSKIHFDEVHEFRESYFHQLPYTLRKTDISRKYNIGNLKAFYVHPLGEKMRFELGTEGTITECGLDYRAKDFSNAEEIWISNLAGSNYFTYLEKYFSFYSVFVFSIFNFDTQIGLRVVKAETEGTQLATNETYKQNYWDFFPTFHLSRRFANKNSFQISYSRRINRPDIRQINPYKDYSGVNFVQYGNPKLKPEYPNSFEIAHSKDWKNTSLNTCLFYRFTDNASRAVTFMDSLRIVNSTFDNYSSDQTAGVEFVLSQQFTKWWNISWNLSAFYRKIYSNRSSDANYTWTSRLVSYFSLPLKISFQTAFAYVGPRVAPNVRIDDVFTIDLIAKREFIRDKFSISLRATDILKQWKHHLVADDPTFKGINHKLQETRVFYITLTYKFNKEEIRKINKNQIEAPKIDDF